MGLSQANRYLQGLQRPRKKPIVEEAEVYERDPISHEAPGLAPDLHAMPRPRANIRSLAMANGGFALLDPTPRMPSPSMGGAARLVRDPRAGAAAPAPQNERLSQEQTEQALRNKLKSVYPDLDEATVDRLAKYGLAKHRARTAAKHGKMVSKPLSRFFSSLVAKENAQSAFLKASERLKPKRAEAEAANDPTLWEPYQSQLDALKVDVDRKTQRVDQFKQLLSEQLKVDPKYLESPLTLFSYMNELAGAQPMQLGEDDDLLDDEP